MTASVGTKSRQHAFLMLALVAGAAATSFPTTLLAASLDVIRGDFHSTTTVISWVQVAPSLAFGLGMPFLGKLGDVHGHRRVYVGGLIVSTVFALATALAWNPISLIVIRTIGQLGGSAVGPSGFAIIGSAMPERERTHAIGRLNTVGGLAPVLGVIVGGPIIDAVGWRSLFLLQTIPCVFALTIAWRVVPDTPRRANVGFDVAGAATLGLGAFGLLLAVNRVRALGVGHPLVIISFVLWPVLWSWFVAIERRTTSPLFPLHYLRRRGFSVASLAMTVAQAGFIGSFVVAPVMVQRLFHFSVTKTSLIQIPRPFAFSVGSAIAGRMYDTMTRRRLQLWGNTMMVFGSAVMIVGALHKSLPLIEVALVTTGFGNGFSRTTLFAVVSRAVDTTDLGIATGVANMVSQIGGAVGTTVMSVVVADSVTRGSFGWSFAVGAAMACLTVPICHALASPSPYDDRPDERSGESDGRAAL